MGSSRLISKDKSEVEYISPTKTFEEMCPIYMSFGMSYDEFWYGSPYRAMFYRNSHKLKVKQKNEEMWMQGMYIYEALCDVSPILHAFSKKGTKPLPYPDKPFGTNVDEKETEIDKEQEVQNARLIARIHFENWARAVKKQFENKQQ